MWKIPAADDETAGEGNKTPDTAGDNAGGSGAGAGSETGGSQNPKAVQTGDATDFLPALVMMFASLSVVIAGMGKKTKKH